MAGKKIEQALQGYTLMISEKPDAMRRIAEALADKNSLKKRMDGNVEYYEFEKAGKKHIIACAVGHLLGLSAANREWVYPIYDAEWKPVFEIRKASKFSEKYFKLLSNLPKGAADYVVCTDFDTEGSVIGYNVLKHIYNVKNGKRMKFSTLTKDELVESYANMSTHLDFGQIEAGLTRHMLDWLWGINLTRALTLAMKSCSEKGFTILSTGRVQGPTLSILFDRELEVRGFKPKPYWQILLKCKSDGKEMTAEYEKDRLWDKKEADKILAACKGKDGVVKDIKKKERKESQPVPFNTTDLLSESYGQFKFSLTQTMSLAEALYQAGIISYPRSSSQKLPPGINYIKILKALATLPQYKKLAEQLLAKSQLKPNEGGREDPAHPAIYPTAEVPDMERLTAQQKKLYDLVVKRFLSVFADEAVRENITVMLDVNGNNFNITGKRTIEPGWIKFYEPYSSFEEHILPDMEIGQKIKILKADQLAKETQPPGRYSQGSIVKEMEKRELGTKATRAEILQTLYDRHYIFGKSIAVTKLGETVTKVLKDSCPRILSEELSRKFEEEMDLVLNERKKREEVIEEAKEFLASVLTDFKKNEREIGKKLLDGLITARKEERRLGACPKCKTGELRIIYSRKSGKRFAGCSNYPKCVNGFPLPQFGMIIPMGKICERCGLPMIQVNRKGARPFRMCINHECITKKDWNNNAGKVGEKTKRRRIKKTKLIY